jgi:predicted HD superfamily hydrolase involved in NAD metabolism
LQEVVRRVQQRVSALPEGLQDHIYRVCDIAAELAVLHGVDPELARLGALAHDVARAMPARELLDRAASFELPIRLIDRQLPVLLHGPVGAELLRREEGLKEQSLHQAVYWHTTAHPSLDSLGKLVFLADKLDPQKVKRYSYQPYLQELAMKDLDRAVLEFLTRELVSLASQGKMVHPDMVEARNALLAAVRTEGPI